MLAQDIIIKPIITEKSMEGLQSKKYTFKVAKDANKIMIANAVEELFDVKVAKVNTMNCRGRSKRVGMNRGTTPSWKKAIVTLTEDSKTIEFFDGMM
ncbi:MAG: 50S ribosomal protein L23 [Oscillospiraceae bacterium]|nr:50S ribosomal protein L23 [Oscillospiraceae bacterium]MDY2848043.1 50S ribosomal protein L23 [Oscillospiraceae bacterium]